MVSPVPFGPLHPSQNRVAQAAFDRLHSAAAGAQYAPHSPHCCHCCELRNPSVTSMPAQPQHLCPTLDLQVARPMPNTYGAPGPPESC